MCLIDGYNSKASLVSQADKLLTRLLCNFVIECLRCGIHNLKFTSLDLRHHIMCLR